MSLHTDATASPTASVTSDTRRALEETSVDEDQSSVVSLTECSVRSGVSSQSFHKSIVKQHICLSGDDSRATFMIFGDEVLIEASKASSSTQSLPYSNKVTLRPVLKFDWEHQYYVGNLVAVHCSLNYVAYALKGNSGGVLRISSRTSSERILVRGFQGRIVDVSFANIISQVLIAAVDESGTFHVYDINVASDGKLESRLLLKVIGRHGNSDYQRVYWCPCFGDEMAPASDEDVDEASRLLVVVNNTTVEVWNVSAAMRQFGSSTRQITSDQVTSGRVVVDCHTEAIVDIALSPDGSMLATASLDGRVKFFSIDMELCSPPSCVRSWLPHSGRPVSAIFFLDNRRQSEAEVWKFLVTLADNGSELKLWDCTSWACLQTITMSPTLSVPQQFQLVPCVKAQLDPTACYLVLADIKRKVMCVIYLHHDSDADSVRAVSVTEFIVAHPCLSLAVYDVSTQCLQCSPDRAADPSHQGVCRHQESDIDNVDKVVILKLYAIQSKMLQELFVYFKPDSSDAFMTTSLFTAGSLFDHDRLSDVSSLSDRLSSPVPDKLTVSAVGLATTTTSTTTPNSSLINTDRVPETAMYMSDSSSFT